MIPRPWPSRLNPDSPATFLSQPQRGGPDTWLRSFKTAFPKYLSDWQMEMLYAGAGGERIGNKTKDARENINSEGGHDGDWRFFSASLFLKFLLKPAERHLFVHATHTKYSLSIQYEPGTGQVLGQFVIRTWIETFSIWTSLEEYRCSQISFSAWNDTQRD